MNYKCEFSVPFTSTQLEADLQNALTVGDAGSVRLGEYGLYAAQFLAKTFLPYSAMVRAYLRLEESSTRLGCRLVPADHVYLMLQCSDGKLRKFLLPSRARGDEALEHIAAKNPDCLIGYQKPATV